MAPSLFRGSDRCRCRTRGMDAWCAHAFWKSRWLADEVKALVQKRKVKRVKRATNSKGEIFPQLQRDELKPCPQHISLVKKSLE
jgi:hypothetical protein